MNVIKPAAVLMSSTLLLSSYAWSANTGELPCKTTAECNAQAEKIGAGSLAANKTEGAAAANAGAETENARTTDTPSVHMRNRASRLIFRP